MKTPKHISRILSTLPSSPGVYMMKNKAGAIIYVGKSVSLRSRVSSYWNDEKGLNFGKRSMIRQVADIEVVETRNELEALVLETNLIKQMQPKYNILMKDDKNLAYIRITNSPVPEVVKTRLKNLSGEYYGPYTAGANVTEIIKVLRRIFHIRSCRVEFVNNDEKLTIGNKSGRSIPCLDYSIGLCPAPCLLENDKIDEYTKNIEALKLFLSGKSSHILEDLRERMQQKAKQLEFEEAQKLKLQIEQIERLGTKQIARDSIPGDYDVIVSIEKYGKVFIGLTEIRDSHIVGVSQFGTENRLWESEESVLSTFLANRYFAESVDRDVRILLPHELTDPVILAGFAEQKREIEYPQIGPKAEILKFTEYNLRSYAEREELRSLSVKSPTRTTQVNILERLFGKEGKWKKKITFECYDISHTAGQFTVASRSVTVNGKTEPSLYRKYKIKTLSTGQIDDFASIREVIHRRTLEGIEQQNFPDLIIIDGGKGQLSSALGAMEQVSEWKNITLPYLCSIVKREEEIFVPGQKNPIIFEKGSLELILIQHLRDEAHRAAIGFNRSARSKSMRRNILDELPGFGPATRRKLLKLAGSIDTLSEVPRTQLENILTRKQIIILEEHGLI